MFHPDLDIQTKKEKKQVDFSLNALVTALGLAQLSQPALPEAAPLPSSSPALPPGLISRGCYMETPARTSCGLDCTVICALLANSWSPEALRRGLPFTQSHARSHAMRFYMRVERQIKVRNFTIRSDKYYYVNMPLEMTRDGSSSKKGSPAHRQRWLTRTHRVQKTTLPGGKFVVSHVDILSCTCLRPPAAATSPSKDAPLHPTLSRSTATPRRPLPFAWPAACLNPNAGHIQRDGQTCSTADAFD